MSSFLRSPARVLSSALCSAGRRIHNRFVRPEVGEPDSGRSRLLALAGRGDMRAQRELSRRGAKAGSASGLLDFAYWAAVLAERGDGEAQFVLSRAYLYGHGVARSLELTLHWNWAAAAKGNYHARACGPKELTEHFRRSPAAGAADLRSPSPFRLWEMAGETFPAVIHDWHPDLTEALVE